MHLRYIFLFVSLITTKDEQDTSFYRIHCTSPPSRLWMKLFFQLGIECLKKSARNSQPFKYSYKGTLIPPNAQMLLFQTFI